MDKDLPPTPTYPPPPIRWTKKEITEIRIEQIINRFSGHEIMLLQGRPIESICFDKHCIPFFCDKEDKELALAMLDPYDEEILKEITDWEEFSSVRVYKIKVTTEKILEVLRKIFPHHEIGSIGLNRP